MSEINYKKLYNLQSEVLSFLKNNNTDFYLTGGTALSRFYLNHRYSVDLDFFLNKSPNYFELVKVIEKLIKSKYNINFETSFISEDYSRLIINDNISLKLEFVNDVEFRYGHPINDTFFKVDNVRNILSNKLTCIVSRDEAKDFFDILYISINFSFNWKEIINEAIEKSIINTIDISQRFSDFPTEWLLKVDWIIEPIDIENIKQIQETISNDILLGSDNSLGIGKTKIEDASINFR